MGKEKPLIIIGGPTAVGKTDLSLQLAKEINGEIISADSMAVYKYMDIGTAKPPLSARKEIPHYLIDIVSPKETFSIKQFVDLAKQAIEEIRKKGKIPIIVGGTYMYIHALLYGLAETPPADWKLRSKLYKIAENEEGKRKLYEELKEKDPLYAEKIHPNDLRRIIRALEVYYITGKPYSSFHTNWNKENLPLYSHIGFFLIRNSDSLKKRIINRVWDMIREGLLGEINRLLKMGFESAISSPQAINYKEFLPYFKNQATLIECINETIRNTIAQSKRQIRWFRRYKHWHTINLDQIKTFEAVELIKKLYAHF
jgi:tRNA dimethylallyltransferase